MANIFYLARQPILSKSKALYGYELLYRSLDNTVYGDGSDETQRTTRVISGALHGVGVGKLVGKALAFLNCGYYLFRTDILAGLNPRVFVLEVLENTIIDAKMQQILAGLHQQGFKIALDDFVPNDENYRRIKPIMGLVDICKIEYPAIKDRNDELVRTVDLFHRSDVRVLVEKLESAQEYRQCREAGADLFQGFFFARPETIKPTMIQSNTLSILRILNLASGDNFDLAILAREMAKYPDLTIKLLQYMNSAAVGMRNKVGTVHQALKLLGIDNLRRWLLILTYSGRGVRIDKCPVLANALKRAHFLHIMAKKARMTEQQAEKAYLVGLLSHLDVIFETPLESILEQFALDNEIKEGLIARAGPIGVFYSLVTSLEQGNHPAFANAVSGLAIDSGFINECLNDAYANSMVAGYE